METVYVKELKHYSKDYLYKLLGNDEKVVNNLLKRDIIRYDDSSYQFNFVGIIIVDEYVINCYPKYIKNEDNIDGDFKQILQVIKKYNRFRDDFDYENDELENI